MIRPFGVLALDYLMPQHAMHMVIKNWGAQRRVTVGWRTVGSDVPFERFGNGVRFFLLPEGRLQICGSGGDVLFEAGQAGFDFLRVGSPVLELSKDGKLVIPTPEGVEMWSSGIDSNRNVQLVLLDCPPYLVIETRFGKDNSTGGPFIWWPGKAAKTDPWLHFDEAWWGDGISKS